MQYVMRCAVAKIHPDCHWGFSVICNFLRKNAILCIAVTMATKCNFLFSARLVPGHEHKRTCCLLLIYKLLHSNVSEKLPKHWKYLNNYPTMAAILWKSGPRTLSARQVSQSSDTVLRLAVVWVQVGYRLSSCTWSEVNFKHFTARDAVPKQCIRLPNFGKISPSTAELLMI